MACSLVEWFDRHSVSVDYMRMQAAYNNTSEIELEGSDMQTPEESASSHYPIGTKVAKQFDGPAGELVWFEGVV
jgi:hypothetical protein